MDSWEHIFNMLSGKTLLAVDDHVSGVVFRPYELSKERITYSPFVSCRTRLSQIYTYANKKDNICNIRWSNLLIRNYMYIEISNVIGTIVMSLYTWTTSKFHLLCIIWLDERHVGIFHVYKDISTILIRSEICMQLSIAKLHNLSLSRIFPSELYDLREN